MGDFKTEITFLSLKLGKFRMSEVLKAVNIKITTFRRILSSILVNKYQYFGQACNLCLEHRGSSFFQNVGTHLPDYTGQNPGRQ
jgi:hypothetical protein